MDFCITSDYPVIRYDVDFVLQQIDLLFDTTPKEVLGDVTFGTEYDRYLYNLNISNDNIRDRILSDIQSLDLQGFSPLVEVYFMPGSERDIVIVDITLSKKDESYNKTYRIR